MKHLDKVAILASILLLAGCASTGDVEALQAEVSALKVELAANGAIKAQADKEVAEAKSLAQVAKEKAIAAEQAAAAKIKSLEEKLDKYFKKGQYK